MGTDKNGATKSDSNFLDCGGKRSATPPAQKEFELFRKLRKGKTVEGLLNYHQARPIENLYAIERARVLLEDFDILSAEIRTTAWPASRPRKTQRRTGVFTSLAFDGSPLERIEIAQADRNLLFRHRRFILDEIPLHIGLRGGAEQRRKGNLALADGHIIAHVRMPG